MFVCYKVVVKLPFAGYFSHISTLADVHEHVQVSENSLRYDFQVWFLIYCPAIKYSLKLQKREQMTKLGQMAEGVEV